MYPSGGILILAACLTACAGFKNTWDVSKEFDQANVLPLEESDLDLISGKRDAVGDPMMGCGMATADRCYGLLPHDGSRPTYLHEEISRIQSAQVCQWFCSDIYSPNCTWFLYDKTTMDCKLFNAPLEHLHEDCQELGFSDSPPYSECMAAYDSSGEDACLYFRQDYCRFDKDLLDNLEYVDNLTHCYEACQIHHLCNFFTYDQMESICKLHHVDLTNRVCDIIHGPPSPTFQSCLDDGMVPWAGMSDDDTANTAETSTIAAVCTSNNCCDFRGHEDEWWKDLTPEVQAVWTKLGWYENLWDYAYDYPEYYPDYSDISLYWNEMTAAQQELAKSLCYDQESWDS